MVNKKFHNLFILFLTSIILTILTSCVSNGVDTQTWLQDDIDKVLLFNQEQNEIFAITTEKRLVSINSKTGKSREIGEGENILKVGIHPVSKNIYLIDLGGPSPGVIIIGKDNKTFKILYDLDWDTNPIVTVPDFVFTESYAFFSAPMNGYVYCVKDSNFEVIWKRKVGQAFHNEKRKVTPVTAIALSPNQKVIFAAASLYDEHPVMALDALTGEILWRYQHELYRHIERIVPRQNEILVPASNYDVYSRWLNYGEYLRQPGGAIITVRSDGEELTVAEIPDVINIREILFDEVGRTYLLGSTIVMEDENPVYNTLALFALNETGTILWDTKKNK